AGVETSTSPTESSGGSGGNASGGGGRQVAQHWPGQDKDALAVAHKLKAEPLSVGAGRQLDLLVRGQDHDPTHMEHSTTARAIRVTVGGKGVTLQLVYQGMLRDEARLRELLAASQTLRGQAIGWQQKLDPASGFDPKSSAGAKQWSQGIDKLI